MPRKSILVNTQDTKKNPLVKIPSKVISRPDSLKGGEETEITAQISVPEEGGWGWIVVIASFLSIFVLDGVCFTFGSLLEDITHDLEASDSLVALINSVAVALYFIAGPLASAFVNRFGFRACTMSGSVICFFSLFVSYFVTTYTSLCIFYGVFAGFGYCLINMAASLVVGFYFERLRALALSIATCGSSVGVMILFPLNTYLVKLDGWRTTTLFHSGLFGTIFFLGMSYRPLLSLTVMKTAEDPTRTVTYLPSVSNAIRQTPLTSSTKVATENLAATAAERLFSAVSNFNYPTAASVIEDNDSTVIGTQPGPSTAVASKLTLTAYSPEGGLSKRQLKHVESIISRSSAQDKKKKNIQVTVQVEKQNKKRGCWARLCHWEPHIHQSRPMYRDDVFYHGQLEKLPVYQRSVMDTTAEARTGLEYQLAVSRAAAATDLQERRGVFTHAVRRVLATMMDPKLLRKRSFILLCMNGCFTYLGLLVPYVYLSNRNSLAGIEQKHCTLFVSAIGFSNACGRLALGAIALKINPIKLFSFGCTVAGISTIVSDLSYNLYYQYAYCCVYGFFISSIACLRSMVLVDLYGLDKLTNATGMLLLFQGIGSLISTPVAGILKNSFGYSMAFYMAGIFITLSGLILIPVKALSKKEAKQHSIPIQSVFDQSHKSNK